VRRTGWIVLNQSEALPGVEMVRHKPGAIPPFHLGQPVPLRYAAVLGMTVCQPWGSDPAAHIFPLFLAGGLILAVSVLLLLRLVRWAESRLHLLRQGMATLGTITHKRAESEDMVRYFLRYGYVDHLAQSRDYEEQVSADQWRKFHVGQPVTVLYDPDCPETAGLYALMKF
jgi:hypothetical protein